MPRHEKEGEAKDLKESNIFLATKGNKKKNSPQNNERHDQNPKILLRKVGRDFTGDPAASSS